VDVGLDAHEVVTTVSEQDGTTAANAIAGHVSGSIVQARDVTGPIIVGPATQRGPGLVSTAVPTGRLGHEVRGREPMLTELTELLWSTTGAVAVLYAAGDTARPPRRWRWHSASRME